MTFEREISRLLLLLLMGLILVMGSAAYWAIAGAESLLQREDNPRQVMFEQSVRRGSLTDRRGSLLAQTVISADGVLTRDYPESAMYGTVGYYSFRYGTAGAEAFYDRYLNGTLVGLSWSQWWAERVLHQPRQGNDVQLTLDLQIQQAAVNALGDQRGAVILLDAVSGDIITLVSRPTYDPNTLDASWDSLTQNGDKPFFNRALQGNFQGGGVLQIPLMAAATLGNVNADTPVSDADAPVQINDITLTCAVAPPQPTLTLAEAFAYGCPASFAGLTNVLDANAIRHTLETFMLASPPSIDEITAPSDENRAVLLPTVTPTATVLEDILGQGRLTVTPMGLARLLSAVASDGTAPALHMALAVRAPNTSEWQPFERLAGSTSLLTSSAARSVRGWMLQNSLILKMPEGQVGSHVALARSGSESQAWFSGFVTVNGQTAVIVIVLENTDDVQAVIAVARQVIQAYQDTYPLPQ